MTATNPCPECQGSSCQEHFHTLLYWENADPRRGVVHHLTVLVYHLQHPSLNSAKGLEHGLGLLVQFVEGGASPQEMRRQQRQAAASAQRKWAITSRPNDQGAYPVPVRWRMRVEDVAAGSTDNYVYNVEKWARLALEDLRAAGIPCVFNH
jgi:hypothetical protein